jgi:superfamily II DNA or RNA helicase/HKD family nuclease
VAKARPQISDGVYEHLVTESLSSALASLPATRSVEQDDLDGADAHVLLARHLANEIMRVLAAIPAGERPRAQIELTNRLLTQLSAGGGIDSPALGSAVVTPGKILKAVHTGATPRRPQTPLSQSTLLTRNRAEPALGHELALEIACADRVDALIAFVTMSGVRALRESLETVARRPGGVALRVLTTVYSGTTQVEALAYLARLPGAEVRVSYDIQRTRLHAKAWMFWRDGGLHTAYVGSANLTSTALGSGQEWMVKLCAADLAHVVDKMDATFATLWNDPEFERFDPHNGEHEERLRLALGAQRHRDERTVFLFDLRPLPFQEEILDRLDAERRVHGRHRNLVVAATGTGKTVLAALDFARQLRGGVAPRLLFLAHRQELLEQARTTFRHALQDPAFGELLGGGAEPKVWDHVFGTIQSVASRKLLQRFGPEHFRYVVVDECHHAPADSYQAVVPHLRPEILLGLTATPERMDNKSLLPDFDGHVAAELRLWHALDKQLLVPFEYYGVSDGIDLTRVRWQKTGYDLGKLSELYTGNEMRVELMVRRLAERVDDVRSVRALAFCVSIEHAEYLAAELARRGIPALAVHGGTSREIRDDAPRRLREREVNVLCTCDLYNEGVDLPFVDTLLLLRPTNSATLFMQQLGRGLRHHRGKTSCVVLDLVGQHRKEFRFDAILAAVTGIPRARLTKAVEDRFPFLPSGCVLQLDAVAREQVLASLREQLGRTQRLVDEVRELAKELGEPPTLSVFLDATGRDVEDLYGGDDGSWTRIRRRSGFGRGDDEETEKLARRLGWLLHVDEASRLDSWTRALTQGTPSSAREGLHLTMLNFQLSHRGVVGTPEDTIAELRGADEVRQELLELVEVLRERVGQAEEIHPVPEWSIALHRHYTRREILVGVGYVKAGEKGRTPQGGILKLEAESRELLLVTLDKSGKSFSPTTRYRDYAISRELFHWETQSIASVSRPSGRRYVDSPGNGWSFYLFVRATQADAYAFLGPVTYEGHTGDRPIAITWRLASPLSANLYDRFATLASG